MDVRKLIRDKEKVLSTLKESKDQLFTTVGCKVYFPKRFEEKEIASVGSEVSSLGMVGIVVGNHYATLKVIAMVTFSPDETKLVDIEGHAYYELSFDPGSVVIPNMNVVKKDVLSYDVYDMFLSKGRIPWYMDYDDLTRLFDTAKEYSGADLGERPEAMAVCVSLIARDPKDRRVYYRQTDMKAPPAYVPMKSVEYGATNTLNKLGGNYFQIGVVSSLIDPAEKVEKIEAILRE